ncbi:MAG: class I SAM-dependent methyltransferase [Parvibaculaceae bacterium]|nr:class I SAM-dependent methyltransferase [Parvibaculaceae bacterium]
MSELKLPGIVPWGRRLSEYRAFFDLSELRGTRVLDVGGGPSSFRAEAARSGADVYALDPLYQQGDASIRDEFLRTEQVMQDGMARVRHRFVWTHYENESRVASLRREAMALFLADRREHSAHYLPGALPFLPFSDQSFDLVTCSHLLFLYGDVLDTSFHIEAVKELVRVGREVRIFPLLNLDGRPSSHLFAVKSALREAGFFAREVSVPFEFQRGATQMLKITQGYGDEEDAVV